MLVFLEIIFAIILAIFLTAVLISPMERQAPGPFSGFMFFFLVLFLAILAGGLWIAPIGPYVFGVPILTFIFMGLLIFFLIAATVPPRPKIPPRTITEGEENPPAVSEDAAAGITFTVFFWIVVFLLILAVLTGFALT